MSRIAKAQFGKHVVALYLPFHASKMGHETRLYNLHLIGIRVFTWKKIENMCHSVRKESKTSLHSTACTCEVITAPTAGHNIY